MKLPKPDLSKDGLKRFALHHVEKVILILALLGCLAFFWLGFSTQRYSDNDPPKLTQKADSAQSYITSNTSWEKISDLRVARDKADAIVRNTKKSDFEQYSWGKFRGTAIRSLQLRQDADLAVAKPQQLEASVFRAPVLVRKDELNMSGESKLDKLTPVSGRRTADEEEEEEDESRFGDTLTDLQVLTEVGVRPANMSVVADRDTSMAINIVSVRALVDHKQLWEQIEAKLKDSFGYYPQRDRPKYQLVQVQRKKVGSEDEWEDLTLLIDQRSRAYSGRGPEVVAPENYDPSLTDDIPPIAMFDYRPYCTHSALSNRSFEAKSPTAMDETGDSQNDGADPDDFDFFGSQRPDDEGNTDESAGPKMAARDPIRLGSSWQEYDGSLDEDGPAAQYKVIRFFDFPKAKAGTEFVYRFRVWMEDPNNEDATETVSTGTGGMPGGRGGRPPGGRGGLAAGGQGGGAGPGGGISGLAGGEGDGRGRGGGDKDGGGFGGRSGPPGLGGQQPPGRGGTGGSSGGTGGKAGGAGQQKVYKKTPILPSQKHISVRKRIDDERRQRQTDPVLKKFIENIKTIVGVDLAHSRATDWTEISVKVPANFDAFAIAGNVTGRQISLNGKSVLIEDPEAEVLVSDWSDNLGTLVSMYRTVRRGDALGARLTGFTKVLHVIDQTVRKLTDYNFRSGKFVVDIMGGRKINYRSSPVDYATPGEVLIMDDDGNIFIHDSFTEKRDFLNRTFSEDESAEYNQRRVRRSDEEDNDGRDDDDERGGFPGGLGAGGDGRGR